MIMMLCDVAALLIWVICAAILAEEDGSLNRLTRIPVAIVGATALLQIIWLLSKWEPSVRYSYPWPRIALDVSVAVALFSRTLVVLIALRRNSGRLFSIKPFGMK